MSSTPAVGSCSRVLDLRREIVCDEPMDSEVFVKSKFGHFAVPLCRGCKADHDAFYEDLKVNQPALPRRNTRRRVSHNQGRT